MKELLEWFEQNTEKGPERKVSGEDAALAELFSLTCSSHNIRYEMILLINSSGFIINALGDTLQSIPLLTGRKLLPEIFDSCPFEMIRITNSLGCTIVSTYHLGARSILESISKSIEDVMRILNKAQQETRHILNCLDYLNSAISIFDKNANLLYTNRNFCALFHIDDPASVLGMNIEDIMSKYGIAISARDTKSSHLKMMDVLKSGEEEINLERLLESKYSPNPIQLVENDILPIFDEKKEVIGVIDIFRSYHQEFQRTKKFIALSAIYTFNDIIHKSKVIDEQIALAKKMAVSGSTVLISGESGVGKELFAQSIHNHSNRRNNPFVALNCASFPSELIASELFGYEAGAFTDASKKGHMGKFELANSGTLFLDEISELPYDSQSKLLRVLETWVISRLGGTKEIPVDVRLIAASNKDLKSMVEKGLFREDLYYRLNSLTLRIPPLRQRPDDIALLADFFLKQSARQNAHKPKKLRADALGALQGHDWPGNVRELKNVMTAITILSKDDVITADTIKKYGFSNGVVNTPIYDGPSEEKISSIKREISRQYAKLLTESLLLANGNKRRAAEMIGVSVRTFYRMLDKYVK